MYAIAFNNPFGCVSILVILCIFSIRNVFISSPRRDKIVTGSFDKTAKVWDAATGECLHTYKGMLDVQDPIAFVRCLKLTRLALLILVDRP